MSDARPHTGHVLALAIVAASLLAAPAARAQGTNIAAAQALFDEAKRLVAQGRIADACPKFATSFKLDPQGGTAMNLADCYEKNGQLASAWASYVEAETLAQRAGHSARQQYAKEHAAALEPRLSRLSIAAPSAPRGLEVRDNEALVDPALLGTAVPVDPGKHHVEARAPGKKAWSRTVEVVTGVPKVTIEIPPLEDDPNAGPGAGPAAPRPPGVPFWTTPRAIGAAVGGAGVVGLAVGAALGAVTVKKMSDLKATGHCNAAVTICDKTGLQMDQSAQTTAHGSTAALAIGGAALATGIVLVAIGGARGRPKTGFVWSVGPVAGAEMTGAFVRGGW